MSMQDVIDSRIAYAIGRGASSKALRMRWASHANDNATLEPDVVWRYLQKVHLAPENPCIEDGNNMDTKVFVRYVWIENYHERQKIRDMLNGLGFYVLNVQDGLEVNAIKSTPDGLIEWFVELFQ